MDVHHLSKDTHLSSRYIASHILYWLFFLCKSEKGRWCCKIGHKIQIMACSVKSWVTFKMEFPESHIHLRNDLMVLIKRFLNFIDQLLLHTERKATATWDSYYKPLKPTRFTGYEEKSKQSKLPSKWKWHFIKWISKQRKNYSSILCKLLSLSQHWVSNNEHSGAVCLQFHQSHCKEAEKYSHYSSTWLRVEDPFKKAVHPWQMWFPFTRPLFILFG